MQEKIVLRTQGVLNMHIAPVMFPFPCGQLSAWDLKHTPGSWQGKLLREPDPSPTVPPNLVRNARLATRAFQGAWPHLPPGGRPRVPIRGDPFFVDQLGPEEPSLLTAALLTPDCKLTSVEVWLYHPAEVNDAVTAIQRHRTPWARFLYPQLLPVWPQPCAKWATFLALPAWPNPQVVICIDARLYDGRVFACVCPRAADRFTILQATGLWGQNVDIHSPYEIHPMRSDQTWQLIEGLTITILPRGQIPAPILDIEVLLNFPISWERGPPYEVMTTHNCYCVATEGGHLLHESHAARSHYYRIDLARLVACPPDRLWYETARPRVRDAAVRGWPCDTVIAAASTAGRPAHYPAHLILVDCRPMLQGWFVTWAEDGWLNIRLITEALGAFAPAGWAVALSGIPAQAGWMRLEPGQWATAFENPALAVVSRAIGWFPKPQPHKSRGYDIPSCVPAQSPACALSLPGTPRCPTGTSRVEMWTVSLKRLAYADGTCRITPFLLVSLMYCGGAVVRRFAMVGILCCFFFTRLQRAAPPARCNRWSPRVCLTRMTPPLAVLLLVSLIQPTASMQFRGVQAADTQANCAVSSDPRLWPAPDSSGFSVPPVPWNPRPLPTPCRSLAKTALPPTDLHYVQEEPLCTLLQESVIHDDRPFFLAATLLDTLVEHFTEIRKATEDEVVSHAPITQARMLHLDGLIDFAGSVSVGPVRGYSGYILSVLASKPPGEVVSIGSTPLGFTWGELSELLRPSSLLFACTHLASAINLCFEELVHQLRALSSDVQRGHLICYTDGSFYPRTPSQHEALGWAVIFLDPHLCQMSYAAGAVPKWAVQDSTCTSAYLTECYALLIAKLIATQSFSCDQRVLFRGDCQSAVGIVEGNMSYQAGSVPQSLANISVLRSCSTTQPDSAEYVPGHAGHYFNELADTLAKAGARHSISLQLSTVPDKLVGWLQQGGLYLPWAATAINSLKGDCTSPPLQSTLGHDMFHQGMSTQQLIEPFVPSTVKGDRESTPEEADTFRFCLTVVSFNTLTLGAALEEADNSGLGPTGLQYKPGRAALLAQQLDDSRRPCCGAARD